MCNQLRWTHIPNPAAADTATREARLGNPGFGRYFTDHMAVISFAGEVWRDARLGAYEPIALSPAASGLHYGQAIFEGLKAYRQPDGDIALFRVRDHAERFRRSSARMAMPQLPTELFIEACTLLLTADRAWVPGATGQSLYLRPLMIATSPRLGVTAADEYLFVVVASPAASYFPGETRPWSVMVACGHVRSAPGGTGAAKCAGNYGASLAAKQAATHANIDEVLWLDATEGRWIEELCGMNVFVIEEHPGSPPTLVTPPIGDTILAGITRASLLALAPRLGYAVREAPIALDEWRTDAACGVVREAFASGTAAAVAPIGRVRDGYTEWTIGDGQPGPITLELREELGKIQEGRAPDPFGWRTVLGLSTANLSG